MTYVDAAVYAVPTVNKSAFREHAALMAPIFKKHGALSLADCWGDDVSDGEVTSFPMAVRCEPGETVAFSYIVWPDKATRDAGMEKAMADMRAQAGNPMPFDGKRMIFAGFEALVEA